MKKWILGLCLFSSALAYSQEAGFTYSPVNKDLWNLVEETLPDKKNTEIYRFLDRKWGEFEPESLEATEIQLAVARLLIRDKMSVLATEILSQIIRTRAGTQASFLSLILLQQIMQEFPIDLQALKQELILDLDLDRPPREIADMLAYFNTLEDRRLGFSAWAKKNQNSVSVGSFWDFNLRYNRALEEVQQNKIDSAIERFASLGANPQVPQYLKNKAVHQYARLVFEKGDFEQAYRSFEDVKLNPRDSGHLLLERAWSKYYLRDYSKSLGLLTALEAPIFDSSRSPEVYVLKMVIYKELCYYDAAFEVMEEFKKRFSKSIETIKKRGDLRKDQQLVNMALADYRLAEQVHYYNEVKSEKKRFLDSNLKNLEMMKGFSSRYDIRIAEVNNRLNFQLRDPIRKAANRLLEWQEQMSFLDYQTRVDSLRISRPNNDFKAEKISLTRFNQVYWLFMNEFWLDELENLKVLVESQCGKIREVGPR